MFIQFLLMASLVPQPVMEAASGAMDSLGMTLQEMNFDRNWATSIRLADSTVVDCVQNVWLLPEIADSVYERALEISSPCVVEGGIDSLVSVLSEIKLSFALNVDTLLCVDSLALLCGGMWAESDSSGTPGEWGLLYSTRGFSIPFSSDELDIDLEEFTHLLERWPVVECPPPELVVGLVKGLKSDLRDEMGALTAPGVEGAVIGYSLDSDVTWVMGGSGRNVYTGSTVYDLIVDVGGDDLYLSGGCGIGVLGNPVGCIADLSGDDTYSSTLPVSQGSGFMGYGVLVDLEGDDVYRGSSMSQGSAVMGCAVFADLGGNDYMTADVHSQGAATLGCALFLDSSGDDVRRVSAYGQGFGGPGGRGSLVDSGGSDTYLAGFLYPHEPLLPEDNTAMSQGSGTGLRPFCAGGIGTLCDLGDGNDTYRAEVFGQGCAYYYSLGVLFDEGGQDTYSSAQYSQGTGIHAASGVLVDMGGDDQYVSRRGPAQGSAHDLSTGFLLDLYGEDYYATDGGQGLALTNSSAVFADVSGTDVYALRGSGHGYSGWARGSAGSALFLDMADRDYYMGNGADSTGWWNEYSAGVDLSSTTPEPIPEPEETGNPVGLDTDSLFAVASEWAVSANRARVLAHREELASRGVEAVDYVLARHLDSWSGLEHRAIKKVLRENRGYSEGRLLSLFRSNLSEREQGNVIIWLGETGGAESQRALEAMLNDSLPTGIVVALVESLGKLGSDSQSLGVLLPLAGSGNERIRRQVAVTLGNFDGDGVLEALRVLSEDTSIAVRSAAMKSLEKVTGER